MDKTKVNHFIFGFVIFLVEVRGPLVLWVCAWGHLFYGERPEGRCFLGGMGAIVFWVCAGALVFRVVKGFIVFWVARGILFSGWCGVY